MPSRRFSRHSLDVIFKLEAEQLGAALGRRFGLDLPPIVRYFPTEIPVADVHLEQLDNVFELADTRLFHLEFQTEHRRKHLRRFLRYDVDLYDRYQRDIVTVVIYGAGVTVAEQGLDFGAVKYTVINVLLGEQDGEHAFERLRERVASGEGLAPEDRLDLVFLPLMRHRRPTIEVVNGAVSLARQLPQEEQRQTLASLIGLGQQFLADADVDALLEGLMTTSIGELLLERGFERGHEQGRTASKREDVLKVLAKQVGPVPSSLAERLLQIEDLERLDALLDAALAASSLEEFEAALG